MILPAEPLPAPAEIEGGGGTAPAPAFLMEASIPPTTARCSPMGKAGAGATTALWPMLISPNRRTELASTLGGGATTDGAGAGNPRTEDAVLISGEGATTDWGNDASDCTEPLTSGAGSTTEIGNTGCFD
jgi:hypothetical protein